MLTFIILSETGNPPQEVVSAATSLGTVFIMHPPGTAIQQYRGAETVIAENIPAALNRIAKNCRTRFLTVAGEDAEPVYDLHHLVKMAPEEAAYVYGDYEQVAGESVRPQRAYTGSEDITERAELGPVALYPVLALKRAGWWNETLKYTFDYDLRLRLAEIGAVHHIANPLFKLHPREPEGEDAALSQKLFFPGRGKYGGFSYLFMEPEEEREIESVFADCLKRRGAYLEGEAPPMEPEPLSSPAVSVITPVYNRERYIGEAIASALEGEFRDFEYIVIDNGSIDGTVAEVEKYIRQDSRVRLLRCPENRIAKSLNLGLLHAQGKYISQLDSDDLYTPDTLRSMVDFMEESGCALGISYYSLIDAEGNDLPEFGIIKHLEYSRNNILRVDGAGAVRVWRKSAMLGFGGFDQLILCDYGEDYDLALKVGERWRVGRCHQVLYKYRRHPDNSDILRDPMFKLRNKNLARSRALDRRKKMNLGRD